MNASIYIFGDFTNGYDQYPQDYTSEIFKKFQHNAKSNTQLCIHRDGDIMYYAYIRKLANSHYLGLCIMLNAAMFNSIPAVFNTYEQIISGMITRGDLIHFDTQGDITTFITQLYIERDTLDQLREALRFQFEKLSVSTLPPKNFSISKDSTKDFLLTDKEDDIKNATFTFGFTYIYKDKNFESANILSYRSILAKQKKENAELKQRCKILSSKLTEEKIKQRNIQWVAALGVVVAIFGAILWNKVLFPSEVTHYETGEYIYYGPLKNNRPNGIGVAIYPENDPDGRRFYVGNFFDGQRNDTSALILYRNGNYYYGGLEYDTRTQGTDFNKSENCHFEGEFRDNKPYNGILYDHKKTYQFVEGEAKYVE